MQTENITKILLQQCVPSCKGPEDPMEIKSQSDGSQALPPAKQSETK